MNKNNNVNSLSIDPYKTTYKLLLSYFSLGFFIYFLTHYVFQNLWFFLSEWLNLI